MVYNILGICKNGSKKIVFSSGVGSTGTPYITLASPD